MLLKRISTLTLFVAILSMVQLNARQLNQSLETYKNVASSLNFRNIGPAMMGGRIADIAVNPSNMSNWYVAVGSGGVWKTTNSGTTWKPIFDNQGSYSIGAVTIDSNNPNVLWVGTGENVSGRHVAWGDGVYKSLDAGATWAHMGLTNSEHIGKILIDPRNSDVVFVAAEGPLWSSGGERGLYKTTDGGKNWQLVLEIDENTGVTDVEFDPSNPDVLYAAAYERRRKTWALLAGGPNSGIYKSTDNGDSWKKVTVGLPNADMGKIGLAVTKANPQIVYATIESDNANKGFYRSLDKGESWEKRNSYTSGGTGPHYYQEIEASQVNEHVVYQMDVFYQVTRDGGKSFDYLETGRDKHSDNHALWIDPTNANHLLAGTDGGLYESFDEGTTWKFFPNLPIAQFYKIAVDNAEPFYNVVAGAQDLGTLIGPTRTMNKEGIRHQDWYVPLGADGYDAAFDPKDPNIVYMEIQQGELNRLDRRTEELIDIKPQPAPNDPPERFNWDSPILISPHDNNTLYFGSQRVWKSENQGNAWTPISGDLTTNTNRYELEMIELVPGVDALYDNGAMSKFSTLTSISESPIQEGLLYTGSDDGVIQITENGGDAWRKSRALPNVPELSFINDVEASSHNVNEVFAIVDAHKSGDYSPYVFLSTDKGKSWKSIAGDLPKGTIAWVIKQDFENENLLFLGTEFGLYFSPNKGQNWIKFKAGLPVIAFRDVELHEGDSDLIGGTFGRGIYVLDDYSPLRQLAEMEELKHSVFSVRDAWWYIEQTPLQADGMPSQGSMRFKSPNPDFGALITYYVHDLPKTAREKRGEASHKLRNENKNVPFPGWDALSEESLEEKPTAMLLIRDEKGEAIRWLPASSRKGFHRTTWDLRLPAPNPISFTQPGFRPPWAGTPQGPLVATGRYSVELFVLTNGRLEPTGEAQTFTVKAAPNVNTEHLAEVAAFQKKANDLSRKMSGVGRQLGEASERIRYMEAALLKTSGVNEELFQEIAELNLRLAALRTQLYGDRTRSSKDEASTPSISSRLGNAIYGHGATSQPPTQTHRTNVRLAEGGFANFISASQGFYRDLETFERKVEQAGAPWTPGRKIEQ